MKSMDLAQRKCSSDMPEYLGSEWHHTILAKLEVLLKLSFTFLSVSFVLSVLVSVRIRLLFFCPFLLVSKPLCSMSLALKGS